MRSWWKNADAFGVNVSLVLESVAGPLSLIVTEVLFRIAYNFYKLMTVRISTLPSSIYLPLFN